ncbi:MAG: LacI family DNA-binding transcriptional regulator, partial [Pseudomonadota bacterium]
MQHAARISDIAKHAGVSTATVDRVLNGRANVRESTRQRVLQARQALESGSALADRHRPWRIKVILPKNAGPSTEYFARCIQQLGTIGQATVECEFAVKIEPVALARKLRACRGQGIDAVVFQALEDPRVAHAVTALNQAGIVCATVLSGMESAQTVGHIGSNNRAAGRTAGLMMGHMTDTPGEVLIVTSGDLYRAHEAREMGFRAVLRNQFPSLKIATSLVGRDDIEHTGNIVGDALEKYTSVVGIYNVGAGNQGIAKALAQAA